MPGDGYDAGLRRRARRCRLPRGVWRSEVEGYGDDVGLKSLLTSRLDSRYVRRSEHQSLATRHRSLNSRVNALLKETLATPPTPAEADSTVLSESEVLHGAITDTDRIRALEDEVELLRHELTAMIQHLAERSRDSPLSEA